MPPEFAFVLNDLTKRYGKRFLDALPPCKVVVREGDLAALSLG